MKNLKRVLSLGLASVMLLGMMVMGASAKDFTDADKIVNGEAVQVLVALKIVNGKEDGSFFDPEGTVTRGEMAKMIAVAMNGGSEANTGVKGTPSFTDIGGHWAEGWIEYCADMGIITGRGDGTFDPNGLVTGTEALKMVLTALGYDAVAYKLTGASWASQTLENARKTGNVKLTESLDNIVMTEPATRDTAAQMIWNGLQAYIVDISPDKNTSSGEVTWGYHEISTTMLELRYGAKVETARFEGNENYSLDDTVAAEGEIKTQLFDNAGDPTGTYWNFPADLDIDYIGEEVKVVWKDGPKSIKANEPDKNDSIFGVFVTGATRVERTTMGKVKDNKNDKQQINLNGAVCKVADTVTVVTNYGNIADVPYSGGQLKGKVATPGQDADNSDLTKALKKDRGDAIKAVFNANGEVDTIYITAAKIGSVSSINSVNVTVQGVGTIKFDGNDVEDGLKKGDVVTVVSLYSNDLTKAVSTVKKAEKVSGEVEAYGVDKDTGRTTNITLSGKKYTVFDDVSRGKVMLEVVDDDGKSVQNFASDNKNTQIGKDFDLYLVNGYVGAAVKTSKEANNYSVITEVKQTGTAGSVFTGVQLQVLGADGTKEIISVSKDSTNARGDAKIEADDYKVGDIVTYSFDKNDLADVTVEKKVGAADSVAYSDKTKTVTAVENSETLNAVATSDCVIYVQTEENCTVVAAGKYETEGTAAAEWKVYNIRDLDSITDLADGSAYAILTNSDGKAVAVFMDLKKLPEGVSDDTVYGIVSAYNGRVDSYHSYTVQSNGAEYTIKVKTNTQIAKNNLVKFNPTADDVYGENSIKVFAKAATAGSNLIKVDNANIGWAKEFSVRDNTLIYYYGAAMGQTVPNVTKEDGTIEYKPYDDPSALTQKTYALAKDAVIVYIDAAGNKSTSEASVEHWSEYTGKKNVMFTTKVVDNVEVINVLFVETSNNKDINGKLK